MSSQLPSPLNSGRPHLLLQAFAAGVVVVTGASVVVAAFFGVVFFGVFVEVLFLFLGFEVVVVVVVRV